MIATASTSDIDPQKMDKEKGIFQRNYIKPTAILSIILKRFSETEQHILNSKSQPKKKNEEGIVEDIYISKACNPVEVFIKPFQKSRLKHHKIQY